jgi:DNA-binding transcriptional LysR family regulator
MLMRSLSHFVALATEKRFVRAAKTCNASRTTLSASIRELEKYLEARLITREGDSIRLTLQGEAALVWARRILHDYEAMQEELQLAPSSYNNATDRLALNKL